MNKAFRRILSAALGIVLILSAALLKPVSAQAATDPRAPQGTITYDFGGGRTFTIGPEQALGMLMTDAAGQYVVNPETGRYAVDPWKCLSTVQTLQKKYPVTNVTNAFLSTRGDLIALPGGSAATYYFDLNTELQYLYSALSGNVTEVHKPSYGGAVQQSAGSINNFGGTYIEIDLTMQTLYYYVGGQAALSTPIVTGNLSRGHGTPTGVFSVRNKQTGTYLIGKDYRSYVNYWCPIIGNSIGIHDATWRSSFGGNIYKTNGSHGCINLPLSAMTQLYPILNVGTPVVVFY